MNAGSAFVIVALSASVVLQVAAALVAWGALRRAGSFRFAWICMSSALIVQLQRRVMPIAVAWYDRVTGSSGSHPQLNELDAVLALAISALMLAGIHGLRSLFHTLDEQAERLRQLSECDPLTGLRNRRSMTRDALREVQRSYRTGGRLSALMLDLDHFKELNDTHGHAAGDTALARLAGVLRCQLREVDLTARWGGEEFLVVLPDTDEAAAEVVAERLRVSLEQASVTLGDHALHVTSSIGAATLQGSYDTCEDALAQLISDADRALYVAKQQGRNRVARCSCEPGGHGPCAAGRAALPCLHGGVPGEVPPFEVSLTRPGGAPRSPESPHPRMGLSRLLTRTRS